VEDVWTVACTRTFSLDTLALHKLSPNHVVFSHCIVRHRRSYAVYVYSYIYIYMHTSIHYVKSTRTLLRI